MRTTDTIVYFVSPTVVPGDVIHIGGTECSIGGPWRELTQPLLIVPGTDHGDYGGGSVEASNERVLLANPEIAPYVVQLIGSHGYSALAYQAYLGPVPLCEPLVDAIESMESYPVLDDEDHSKLEADIVDEAWKDSGRNDFRRALRRVLDELDGEEYNHDVEDNGLGGSMSDDTLDELWREGCDVFNVEGGAGHIVETGCLVCFRVREWEQKATAELKNKNGTWARFRDKLLAVAAQYRHTEECDSASECLAVVGEPCRWATCPLFGRIVVSPGDHAHHSEVQ